MNQVEFSEAANQIAEYLGASAPSATRIYAWLPKVENIPAEAVPFIVQRITDEAERMPVNLPKSFREQFSEWLRRNPNKVAKEADQAGCSDCENGILWLERGRETCAVYCANCFTGMSGNVGMATLYSMQQKGWKSRKYIRSAPQETSQYHDILEAI